MKGGSNVVIEQHRHEGVFIARGKEDALVTKNLVPGVRCATEVTAGLQAAFPAAKSARMVEHVGHAVQDMQDAAHIEHTLELHASNLCLSDYLYSSAAASADVACQYPPAFVAKLSLHPRTPSLCPQ